MLLDNLACGFNPSDADHNKDSAFRHPRIAGEMGNKGSRAIALPVDKMIDLALLPLPQRVEKEKLAFPHKAKSNSRCMSRLNSSYNSNHQSRGRAESTSYTS